MRAGLLTIGFVALALVALPLRSSVVHAQKATTDTFHEDVSETDQDNICGEDVTVYLDYSATGHFTDVGGVRGIENFHAHGSVSFVLNGVEYTGTFNDNGKEVSGKGGSESEAFTGRAWGDDGSRILLHGNVRVTVNANGEVTADIDLYFDNCPEVIG